MPKEEEISQDEIDALMDSKLEKSNDVKKPKYDENSVTQEEGDDLMSRSSFESSEEEGDISVEQEKEEAKHIIEEKVADVERTGNEEMELVKKKEGANEKDINEATEIINQSVLEAKEAELEAEKNFLKNLRVSLKKM